MKKINPLREENASIAFICPLSIKLSNCNYFLVI